MTETSDSALPAVGQAAAERVKTVEEAADVDRREDDALVEYAATWKQDDINRAVIVDIIHTPGELVDEHPPVVAVEYSAWCGPSDGSAEALDREAVVDLFDDEAEELAVRAVERAHERAIEVDEEELDSVSTPKR